MMETELYLNDELMDLAPDTVIALTLQVNDLSNLQDRQGSFSNSIALPKTDRNRKILEFAEQISSFGNSPYRKISAKYKRRGAELISAGFAIIEDTQDNFDVTVYYSNALFFTNLQGLNLIDLDLTAYNFLYSIDNIIDNINNIDGVLYPVLDYTDDGLGLKNSQPGDLGVYLYMQYNMFFPAFYVHTLFKEIFKQAGYGLRGKIFSDPKFLNLILPYSQSGYMQYTAKQQQEINTVGIMPNNIIIPTGSGANPLFTGDNFTDGLYSFNKTVHLDLNLVIHINITGHPGIIIEVFRDSDGHDLIDTFSDPAAIGDNTYKLSGSNVPYNGSGITVLITLSNISGGGSATILKDTTQFTVNLNPTVGFGDNLLVYPQSIFADMSQTDFIKSICNMFGLIPQFNVFTNTMDFVQFTELYDNRSMAKDWTGKIDQSIVPKTEYRIGNYGQNTWARYKHDDTVDVSKIFTAGNSEQLNYGDGKFIVDDQTLPLSVDMITLPYAGTRSSTWDIGRLANIKLLEARVPANSVQQRILMGVPSTNKTIRLVPDINSPDIGHSDYYNQQTVINTPYFEDASKDINLGFDNNLLAKQYAGLSDQMLKRVKMVTAYFKLSLVDIGLINHFIPVYLKQFGAYFYVNQIVQYIDESSSVQVILIRM